MKKLSDVSLGESMKYYNANYCLWLEEELLRHFPGVYTGASVASPYEVYRLQTEVLNGRPRQTPTE